MLESVEGMHHDAFDRLTPRERQVLEMTARGLTNRQIADGLVVTVHAIKFHLAMIYRKLNVANRTEAAFLYLNRSAQASTTGREDVT